MANVDEELTIRRMLADLMADQPPEPPSRYAAVRRQATVHRRRQLAGVVAAVVILALAAIAIPLGLVHFGPTPPGAPSRHYRISQQRPAHDAKSGLIATGIAAGQRWKLSVRHTAGKICEVEQFPPGAGTASSCAGGSPAAASRSGDPVTLAGADGSRWQLDYGTVRSDVTYLTVSYNNGQVIPVYPVAVFSARYARYFAFAAPYSAAITQITVFTGGLGSGSRVLAYTVPFTGGGSIEMVRWLEPGQPAEPRPERAIVGSGRVNGNAWHGLVNVGPWGTCFAGVGNAVECSPRTAWPEHQTSSVDQLSSSGSGFGFSVVFGETSRAVSYLILTTTTGRTAKVFVVSVADRKFFAYATATRDPVVQWSAYNADGQQVGSGRPMQ
ncbi:MAG TPA: hypothetical protein VMB74_11865 [Streptosporangiaceae bacterium]|nr:hypothetical protein [Streptosporangiaceae bacterium]